MAIIVQLDQHCPRTYITRINVELELTGPVRIHQHRSGDERSLQLVERLLSLSAPEELHSFFGQTIEGSGNA